VTVVTSLDASAGPREKRRLFAMSWRLWRTRAASSDFRAAFLQLESDFDSNSCDEITVLWRENIVGITTSHEEVGKRFTNEISEYRGIGSGVRRATEPGNGYGFAPVKARLGVGRGRDRVFKCNVFLEEREFGFHIYRSGLWGEVNKNA
jgi:hypothetical protein